MTTPDVVSQLPADLRQRFSEFLDRAEVTELVLRFHAHVDRWDWDAVPSMITPDCRLTTHIDGAPVFVNWDKGENTGLSKKTNWREEAGIRGQHQWTNVVVNLDGDSAQVMMSGTQTNSWPDGGVEVSGVLGQGTCRRTPDGWRIADFIGNYRSNHARLRLYFTTAQAHAENSPPPVWPTRSAPGSHEVVEHVEERRGPSEIGGPQHSSSGSRAGGVEESGGAGGQ